MNTEELKEAIKEAQKATERLFAAFECECYSMRWKRSGTTDTTDGFTAHVNDARNFQNMTEGKITIENDKGRVLPYRISVTVDEVEIHSYHEKEEVET